ncbi:MAG TPA: sigma-70 family RNA polymerase sigma factor [Gaiellaceae bacterium]|nr:sigma-70 family RNA polymerase sigma factor [Gaiellaceae bacterium]
MDTATRADAVLAQIEKAYRERYPMFLRVATAIVGDADAARDAVHDAFVRAVRHRRRYRGGPDIEPWLWRIVVNAARKRRRGATELPVGDVEIAAPATPPNGDLWTLVASLPERQRHALFLRYYADLDYRSIAEALGVKPGTVAASLHGAHQTLRRRLEEMDH